MAGWKRNGSSLKPPPASASVAPQLTPPRPPLRPPYRGSKNQPVGSASHRARYLKADAFGAWGLVRGFLERRRLLTPRERGRQLYWLLRSYEPLLEPRFRTEAMSLLEVFEPVTLERWPPLLELLRRLHASYLPTYQPPLEGELSLAYKRLVDAGISSVEVYRILYEAFSRLRP